jgi:hypothetical protein
MRAVAGAYEAGQTPPAADGTQQTADQTRAAREPSSERADGSATEQTARPDGKKPEHTPLTEQVDPETEQVPQTPGFGERGRMRRRARFLRKARELAYRDLGGLVFDLHRFGQRNDQLVLAKLATLRQIDTEVRELEAVLGDRRPVTVLREVGIAACPRCAAIHGSDDRFCPGCGLAFDMSADRPISSAPVSPQAHTPASTNAQAPTNAHAPTNTTAPTHAPTPTNAPTSANAPAPTNAPTPTNAPVSAHTPTGVETPGAISAPRVAPATPATTQHTIQMSPISPQSPPPSAPKTSASPPRRESAPPVKTTAAPVAAKPATAPARKRKEEGRTEEGRTEEERKQERTEEERKQEGRKEEDEPTQILRPPTGGA